MPPTQHLGSGLGIIGIQLAGRKGGGNPVAKVETGRIKAAIPPRRNLKQPRKYHHGVDTWWKTSFCT